MKRRISVRVRPLAGRCYTLQLHLGHGRRSPPRRGQKALLGWPAASFDLKHGAGGATWCTNDAEMLEELEGDPGHPGPGATSVLPACGGGRRRGRRRRRSRRARAPRGRAPRLLRACAIL